MTARRARGRATRPVTARRALAGALILLLAACGRRGPLRLPERDGGESAPAPKPAATPDRQRRPSGPLGLETG